MKIGDEVYVHGYVDEIRTDVVIIRNEGGYFGTVPDEVAEAPSIDFVCCGECKHHEDFPTGISPITCSLSWGGVLKMTSVHMEKGAKASDANVGTA